MTTWSSFKPTGTTFCLHICINFERNRWFCLSGLSFRCKGVTETTSSYEKCLEEINCMWWITPTKNGQELAEKRKMYVYDSQKRFKVFFLLFIESHKKDILCFSVVSPFTEYSHNSEGKEAERQEWTTSSFAESLKASQLLRRKSLAFICRLLDHSNVHWNHLQ